MRIGKRWKNLNHLRDGTKMVLTCSLSCATNLLEQESRFQLPSGPRDSLVERLSRGPVSFVHAESQMG